MVCFAQGAVVGVITQQQIDARTAIMKVNLAQKYGATWQDSNREFIPTDEILAKGEKYKLSFPDGATGDYTIRFDRATSEPFVVAPPHAPSPDQLEQSAQK